jgi:hypothetical protein
MLDDRTGSTKRLPEQFGKYVWNPDANRYGWTSLLGVPAGSSQVPENAMPARVKDRSALAAHIYRGRQHRSLCSRRHRLRTTNDPGRE